MDNQSAELFCIELNVANRKELLFAMSDLDREEWIDAIRKYCTQSNIENTYLKSSKLGAGTHYTTTVVQGADLPCAIDASVSLKYCAQRKEVTE